MNETDMLIDVLLSGRGLAFGMDTGPDVEVVCDWTDPATGLRCLVRRNPVGPYMGFEGWLGYVRIPENHPWYGVFYDDIPADVHGGLTYGDTIDDFDGYWLGFDFMHYGDEDATQADAEASCLSLAQQVVAASEA